MTAFKGHGREKACQKSYVETDHSAKTQADSSKPLEGRGNNAKTEQGPWTGVCWGKEVHRGWS